MLILSSHIFSRILADLISATKRGYFGLIQQRLPILVEHTLHTGLKLWFFQRKTTCIVTWGPATKKNVNRTAAEYGIPHLKPKTIGLVASAATNAIR